MSVTLDDLIAGAATLANLEDLGDGPNDFLTTSQWANLVNGSIEALDKKIVIWNERAKFATQDYDLTVTGGDITPPVGYRTFKQLSILDGNGYECRPVHRYTAAQLTNLGDVHYQPQGLNKILLRPQLQAKQKYRLSYTAGPTLLSGGDAPVSQQAADATAKAMIDQAEYTALAMFPFKPSNPDTTTIYSTVSGHVAHMAGALPSGNTWAGSGTGPTRTLTGSSNTPGTMDGVVPVFGDRVFVFSATNGVVLTDLGIYRFSQIANGSQPYILVRTSDFSDSTQVVFGTTIYVSAGTVNAGLRFSVISPNPIVVDTSPMYFVTVGAPRLAIDGAEVSSGDKIFINTQGLQKSDGLFDLSLTNDINSQYWTFTRSSGQAAGTVHPIGYAVAVTQGINNGNRIWLANGDFTLGVIMTTWTTLKSALDPLYEPAREWLEVRTAIRALGKEESNETATALNARLAELTNELFEFYKNLDQGEAPQATRHDYDSGSLGWRLYNGII